MRIAIVQVGWPIQSYTRDLVNGLVGRATMSISSPLPVTTGE